MDEAANVLKTLMLLRKASEQSGDEGELEIHNKQISRLFVRSLAFSCTERSGRSFGEISQVSFILNHIFLSWITFFLLLFTLDPYIPGFGHQTAERPCGGLRGFRPEVLLGSSTTYHGCC